MRDAVRGNEGERQSGPGQPGSMTGHRADGSPAPAQPPAPEELEGGPATEADATDATDSANATDATDEREPLGAAVVITCSTRAANGIYPDRGGPLIVEALRQWGFEVGDPLVVPDGPAVGEALEAALTSLPEVVITTGGTGLSPTDRTPEATLAILDREVPGLAEAIRGAGLAAGVPTAALSRGLAGVAGTTLVVNLPGSTGGVRDGLAVLGPVLPHALSQIRGGDH